jgi:hypothetical protein
MEIALVMLTLTLRRVINNDYYFQDVKYFRHRFRSIELDLTNLVVHQFLSVAL